MKSLSSALSAALGAPVQRPAVLVQIGFEAPVYWSSFDNLSWNGHAWQRAAVSLEGLQVLPLMVRGTLVLGNASGAVSTLVLADGIQDREIRVWGYDAAATGALDVVWLADAVGASAEISPVSGEVRVSLRHRAELVQSPRVYVTREAGFEQLMPAGTALRINGIDFILQRS